MSLSHSGCKHSFKNAAQRSRRARALDLTRADAPRPGDSGGQPRGGLYRDALLTDRMREDALQVQEHLAIIRGKPPLPRLFPRHGQNCGRGRLLFWQHGFVGFVCRDLCTGDRMVPTPWSSASTPVIKTRMKSICQQDCGRRRQGHLAAPTTFDVIRVQHCSEGGRSALRGSMRLALCRRSAKLHINRPFSAALPKGVCLMGFGKAPRHYDPCCLPGGQRSTSFKVMLKQSGLFVRIDTYRVRSIGCHHGAIRPTL